MFSFGGFPGSSADRIHRQYRRHSHVFILIFLFFLFTHWLFRNRLCNFYMFVNFPNSLLLLVYSLWLKNVLCMILILFRVVCSQHKGYSERIHIHFRRMCILLLYGIFCQVYLVYSACSGLFLLIFCLIFRFIIESKVWSFQLLLLN